MNIGKKGNLIAVFAVLVIGVASAVLLFSGTSSVSGAVGVGDGAAVDRTTICHNGFKITVPDDIAPAHFAHGDCEFDGDECNCAEVPPEDPDEEAPPVQNNCQQAGFDCALDNHCQAGQVCNLVHFPMGLVCGDCVDKEDQTVKTCEDVGGSCTLAGPTKPFKECPEPSVPAVPQDIDFGCEDKDAKCCKAADEPTPTPTATTTATPTVTPTEVSATPTPTPRLCEDGGGTCAVISEESCELAGGTVLLRECPNVGEICCKEATPTPTATPFCGNGNVEGGEACDPPLSSCGTAGTCSIDCTECVEPTSTPTLTPTETPSESCASQFGGQGQCASSFGGTCPEGEVLEGPFNDCPPSDDCCNPATPTPTTTGTIF